MKIKKRAVSVFLALSVLFSCAGFGSSLRVRSAEAQSILPFNAGTFRRPFPLVSLDVTDVTRVGAPGDTNYGSGTTIKKSTLSGVPYITGTYASQCLAGETPVWPQIVFTSSVQVTITSVTVTGGTVSPVLISGSLNSTTAASWEIRGGTATAGSTLKIAVVYTYVWNNPYTGTTVTDTYTTYGYSYVENIIFPAGVWAFASAYGTVANAADVQVVSRILGRGVYAAPIGREANSSNDYSSGYFNFAVNAHIDDGDTSVPKKTMLIADPPHKTAYDQFIANGTGTYASGDSDRGKVLVYLDSSLQNMQANNVRMHFFIHGNSRSEDSGRDLTYETIHVRDGDVSYSGGTGDVLGVSGANAYLALNPSGPLDGTTATGGGYLTAGMQTTSTLYGTGTAGSYTLVTQWTARGDDPSSDRPNWMKYYHAVTVEIIPVDKSAVRTALNSTIGIATKTVTGAGSVTTVRTQNALDPTSSGVPNTNKGKNIQSWYYSAGWPAFVSAYDTAWLTMHKPNASQSSVAAASSALTAAKTSLTLAGSNFADAVNPTLPGGCGNTYYGSAVKPLGTILDAVNNADASYHPNLAFWREGTHDYYTDSSRANLETVYAAAAACRASNCNVLFQPYADYLAQQLTQAVASLELKQVMLSFDGNEATGGAMDSTMMQSGSVIPLPPNGFEKTGCTFIGWSNSPSGAPAYADGDDYTAGGSDSTLYAVWSANEYTITFDAAGGTGSQTLTLAYGSVLTAPEVSRTGFAFTGWQPELPPVVPPEDITYTAQWSPNSYTVTFDATPGNGSVSYSLAYGSALVPPVVWRTGYKLAGWLPELPATVCAGDVLYKAQWQPNIYHVNFCLNGGSGTLPPQQSGAMGTDVLLPPRGDIQKQYYNFLGWALSPSATGPLAAYTIPAGDTTLYAVWARVPVALIAREGSATLFGNTAGTAYIYGLKAALTQNELMADFLAVTGDGRVEITLSGGNAGTGSQLLLYDNVTGALISTYRILIFGDVNGDGNIDSSDAGRIVDVENFLVTWDPVNDALYRLAADVNGDGNIDAADAGNIIDCENFVITISQTG